MWTQLEAFQRLDSRFRGNDKQGGNDEGDAFPWSPYPKLGFPYGSPSSQSLTLVMGHIPLPPMKVSSASIGPLKPGNHVN